MCGIAGRMLREPGPVGRDLVELMDAQIHRGADSTGFALYGPPRDRGYVVRAVGMERRGLARDLEDFLHTLRDHGVAMKGGDILVEGRIGYLSGFMAHAGRIIALGGADDACADSLWGGEVWLAAPAKSLGIDTRLTEPDPEEVAAVEALLAERGLADSSREWRKIVSAQRLWHFESRDAQAWLMI